jgi:hypothetical protein
VSRSGDTLLPHVVTPTVISPPAHWNAPDVPFAPTADVPP